MAAFKHLSLESLTRGTYQPRTHFDAELLQELAQSIRTHGIIQPLIVRQICTEKYEIIAGERRWRAAMLAGLTELPCMIHDFSNAQVAAVSVLENIQRENLNLIEEAAGYKRLLEEFCFTQEEIACLLGKSRSHIANILRLLNLCEEVQHDISTGELSLGHARMLVSLNKSEQIKFALLCKKNQWSVRTLEKALRETQNHFIPASEKNSDLKRLQNLLAEQIGSPVQIELGAGKEGWLKIKFFDNDTLSGLLDKLGLRYD